MARVRKQQPLVPSLLDRLINDNPEVHREATASFSQVLREIKVNVRRDLENLLNTRLYHFPNTDIFEELTMSSVNYGLPDFSHIQFENPSSREHFRFLIERTITYYEPRFRRVEVDIVSSGKSFERVLHLKISAILMVEPDPIPLIFDTQIKSDDRMLSLRELTHG